MLGSPRTLRVGLVTLVVLCAGLTVVSRFRTGQGFRPGGAMWVLVSREEYGSRWPFEFEQGLLMCPGKDKVVIADKRSFQSYSLTQAALNSRSNWPAYQTVMVPGASEALIPELIERGLGLCTLNPGGEGARSRVEGPALPRDLS